MKRTLQPKKRQRSKEHGFMKRMKTRSGRNVLKARRAKGRKVLSAQYVCEGGFYALFVYVYEGQKKLKKTDIIKKNYEFKYFFKKGNYFSGHLIEVFVFNSKYYKNKLGVVVSKKVGGSVTRNRLKRFIREAYTNVEDSICVNCNLLIVWKKNVNPDKAP